ncbi:prephenate dehydratase [Pandoraea apista]|uniref:prephenate dehydratase n=1 Tax=Pandoraea apista TaxID=93218 RepID=UPI00248D5961|nr:prephenate dehydratase domain-containing protein [Pandoraea apista]
MPRLSLAFVLASVVCVPNAGAAGNTGYLGPAGSWTHQACLDLFGASDLVPLTRDELFAQYKSGKMNRICVPVTTSAVGVTPYLDDVLNLPEVQIVEEYPKTLGYSLLANPDTKREDIKEVLAHPVALEEVKPWLDKEMPNVKRVESSSGGAAAQSVATGGRHDQASMGPKVGGEIYGLVALVSGIEEGPQNVTRWWVLGRDMPAATGNDKTSLLVETSDAQFSSVLEAIDGGGVKILDIYERPSKKTLDTHKYVIEVEGHAKIGALAEFLAEHQEIRVLGSYPRKY